MLTLVDSTELNVSVLQGRLIVCKLNPNDPTASCIGATSANKVIIRHSGGQDQVQYLNVDQEVTALSHLNAEDLCGSVALGTASHLLVYDTIDNKIIMTKEVEDGVGSMVIGPYGDADETAIIVGGNCFLQCFNTSGDERFWNVMSDQVTALALVSCDGHNQLITGTEDGNLRLFKNARLAGEMKETDAITALTALSDHCFAYALANGTVGVYQKKTRLWRVKSKNHVVALSAYDVDNDGQLELICAWSHGRFDARHWQTGEVVFKEKLSAGPAGTTATQQSIAALAVQDWLQLGHAQLIVCTQLGQLRSYLSSELELNVVDRIKEEAEEDAFRQLLIRKQNLLAHLEPIKQDNDGEEFGSKSSSRNSARPSRHTGERIQLNLSHDEDCVSLSVQADEKCNIQAVIVFAEGVFPNGESYAIRPVQPGASTHLKLPIQRNSAVELHVHVLLNTAGSNGESLCVVESILPLPFFARFKPVQHQNRKTKLSTQFRVKVRLQERIQRIVFWMEQNFLLPSELTSNNLCEELPVELDFEVLPSRAPLYLTLTTDGHLFIDTEKLDCASELIQHLAGFLNVQHLTSEIEAADLALRDLLDLMQNARELQAVRQRLTVDMANQVGDVRNVFADSEAARLLGDMAELRRCYAALTGGNRQLAGQQVIRQANYSQLMDCLKQINLHVQHAARCRVGRFQEEVVQASRLAIKNLDFDELIKITLYGTADHQGYN